jgi:hypothetical protein
MVEDSQAYNKSTTMNNERGFFLIFCLCKCLGAVVSIRGACIPVHRHG